MLVIFADNIPLVTLPNRVYDIFAVVFLIVVGGLVATALVYDGVRRLKDNHHRKR